MELRGGQLPQGRNTAPFDLLYWNSDSTNLPGPFYAWYLRSFYLENNLVQPGKLTVCGEKLDLRAAHPARVHLRLARRPIVPINAAYASTQVLPGKSGLSWGLGPHRGVINPLPEQAQPLDSRRRQAARHPRAMA